ncbi:hypothetical protein PHLGIDRAFT_122059 [Phlebiopsis gigantea 11061_1 CR5-6]|uniref:Uncharacterized protein n=1 Tax=Phlebiopsis gigantea (strain 11061_1 CR5-6) TaxID=745531 RepID=A0A0C3S4C9_PHLG1|nr:hypothetical protein PHLGIDRAFT_122059 [Phlebiopsis gigantea 11061_1 CR5-6]
MVQGTTKGLKNKKGNSSRHAAKAASSMKKGQRYVAPKKAAAVKSAALHKELSAKISKSIEQQVAAAASSGKLTIMKNVAMEGVAEKDKAKVKSQEKKAS